MKKKSSIIIMLVLILLYVLPLTGTRIDAYKNNQIEITRINTSSLEDNFTDNTIAVVLSKEATFSGKVFTPSDFPEIDAILVEDETVETMAIVNAQIAAEESGMLSILQAETSSISMSRGILNRSQMTRYEKIIPFVERNLLFETDSFRRILRITLSQNCKENVLKSIRLLEQRDEIISACPDYIETISSSFIDFEPTNINLNWRNLIGLPAAHAITTGSANIRVGVIDSGIDAEHFNLAGKVCEDLSKNFVADDYSALTDPDGRAWGHGTHVAGIIGTNWIGTINERGVNNNVTIVSLRVFDEYGNTTSEILRNAINHGTDNAINIMNFSGSGTSNNSALRQAIENFPGLFVAAVGNNGASPDPDSPHHALGGWDNDRNGMFPANHRLNNLISVGATTSTDARSDFSNFGTNNVCIFAPGTSIRSTWPGNWYENRSGTSMAAPFVAGTAALMMAVNPHIDAPSLRRLLLDSTDMITITVPIRDDNHNFLRYESRNVRRLNVHGAVVAAATTPSVGRYRISTNNHFAGEEDFYFINRLVGFSSNAYIAIPDVLANANAIFPHRTIVGATLRFNFSSNRSNNRLSAQVRDTLHPRNLGNAPVIMNLTVNHSNASIGVATIDVFNHINTSAPSGGIGIISLFDEHSVAFPSDHRISFSNVELIFDFVGFEISGTTVTGFIPPSNFNGNLNIPSGITAIAPFAFAGNTSITNVHIPNSVTSIGAHAFDGAVNLTRVSLPLIGNLTTIEDGVFRNTGLIEVTIPNFVTSIGASAFEGTANLTRVLFISSTNLQTIGDAAFKNSGLTEFTILRSVTNVGVGAFENSNLNNLIIHNNTSLHTIESRAFMNTRLTSITIPSTVRYIGSEAFRDITTLRNVQFADNSQIVTIPERTFQGTGLTTINLPDSVTSIGDFAFLNVQNLNSIGLPNALRRIGNSAFENTGLRNITIPRQVYFIGTWAFAGTLQLTTVDFAPDSVLSGISQGTFQNSRLNSINLPNSLRSIEISAFANTQNLTGIVIPNGVVAIRESAFHYSALRSIVIPASVEMISSNAFRNSIHLQTVEVLRPWSSWIAITSAGANFLDNTHPNLVIGVPDTSSLTAYRNAPNWNSHAHRMVSRAVHVCNYALEPFCNTYHWFICFECGDFFFERHTWHFDWGSNTAICTVCGLVLQNGRSLFLELLDSGFEMPLAILKEFNELEYLIS